MKFKPGESGNPQGKPKGAKDKRTGLRALLEPHARELVQKVVSMALEGDTTALRICIDRLIAPIKGLDMPITIGPLEGSMVDQGKSILAALSDARISPDQAATLMQTIAAQARIIEVDDLEKRISNLENAHARS